MADQATYHHERLASGVEFTAIHLPGRRVAAFEIRILAGIAHEPAPQAGVARLVEETLGKGTEKHSAQELTDAFDAIGAQVASAVGRESTLFRCTCLPEYLDEALALHAEMLRTPAFPEDFCRVAIDLGLQELTALEDEPGDLARRLIGPHAYGPQLGRHDLGTRDYLKQASREDIVAYWRQHFGAARMQVAVGGAIDVDAAARRVDQLFEGFGSEAGDGRTRFEPAFAPGTHHQDKQLEQEHMILCWPGVPMDHPEYPVERLTLGVLGDGMSSRLFTEVREKQGLVYWVGAWDEHPRGQGRLFIGASTKPDRCDQTFRTLLREVDRVAHDLKADELERAKVGIIAKTRTHGDITRARTRELSSDLFQYGRPVPTQEKNEMIASVTIPDVQRYLHAHPRDKLCVQTLGPRALEVQAT